MATAGSEVTTSRIRAASQSIYTFSLCSSEDISLDEAFHPLGAVPELSPTRPPSDDIVLRNLEHQPLDCHACQVLLEETGLPMHCLELPYTKPSLRSNLSETVNEATGVNDEASSVPTRSRYHASLLPSTKIATCFDYVTSIPSKICHRWLGSLLGLSSLALAIVSLLMYTIHSYRMAVWTTRNDELQACTGLIQAERPIGPNCERLISEGPQDPPYNLSRRMTKYGGPGSFFNLSDLSIADSDLLLPVEMRHSFWLVCASIFALISLADLLLNLLRKRFRTEDDFEEFAAIEMARAPDHDDRSKTMDTDHLKAWHLAANLRSSTKDLRRRTRLGRGDRQVGQHGTSIEDQPVGKKDTPYSIARYLNQPPNATRWERFLALPGRDS